MGVKLVLDTAGRRVNVSFLMEPGEEIEVSEARAAELERRYSQVRFAGETSPGPKGADTANPATKPAPRKRGPRKSAAKAAPAKAAPAAAKA